MRNVKEVMAVGNEKISDKRNSQQTEDNINVVNKRFRNWLLGIALSFLPLLALPFYGFINSGNISAVFWDLFCDISVMFVGISFTITALNDFLIECTEKGEDSWILLNIVLLLLGAIFYTTVVIQKANDPEMNMNVVFGVNLLYFTLMLLLSASKYVRAICDLKRN